MVNDMDPRSRDFDRANFEIIIMGYTCLTHNIPQCPHYTKASLSKRKYPLPDQIPIINSCQKYPRNIHTPNRKTSSPKTETTEMNVNHHGDVLYRAFFAAEGPSVISAAD